MSAPFNSVNKKAIVGRYCCHASLCKEGFLRILLDWLLGNSHLLPTVNINYVVLCFLFLMSGRKLFKNSFVFFFLAIVVDLFRRIVRRAVPWEPFSSLASIFLLRLWWWCFGSFVVNVASFSAFVQGVPVVSLVILNAHAVGNSLRGLKWPPQSLFFFGKNWTGLPRGCHFQFC